MNALGGTIIIVNAEPQDAVRYARILRAGISECLDIATAATVEDGVTLCRDSTPYCVLLAHEPPSTDGLAFVTSLKFAQDFPIPPVVMITGDGGFNVSVGARREVDSIIARSDLSEKLLVHAVDSAVRTAALRREVAELRAELARLEFYDSVTELAGRSLFEDRVGHAIALSERTGADVSLLHIRLEGLRKTHKAHGLAGRDGVLREAGARLAATTRQADLVARLDHEEFAVLMESGGSPDGAETLAQRIAESLSQPYDVARGTVALGVEIGQSHLTGPAGDRTVRAGKRCRAKPVRLPAAKQSTAFAKSAPGRRRRAAR